MGEAKRRKYQSQQQGQVYDQRLDAGDFGEKGQLQNWVLVFDKSSAAQTCLNALKTIPAFKPVFDIMLGEAFQVWNVSPLFQYVIVCSGEGSKDARTFVAANLDILKQQVLPKVKTKLADLPASCWVWGVENETEIRA